MTAVERDARRHLTRHFFEGFFDLGELATSGYSSLPRTIAGVCGVLLAIGFLLTRVYLGKYEALGDWPDASRYLQAVVADQAFLIAFPMWIVAFVAVLVSPSLFPDETDFRVLMALPVTRRVVFGAKLLALARFAGIFVVTAHAAMVMLLFMISMNPWSERNFAWHLAAYLAASIPASMFAVLCVAAVRALLLLLVPRAQALTASAAVSSLMLFLLVLSLPLVAGLSTLGPEFARGSPWLYAAPPAWFAGIDRWFLGDARFAGLALCGAAAFAVAGGIAAAGYLILYRHFDRVMVRPAAAEGPPGRRAGAALPAPRRLGRSRPVFVAVRRFAFITFRRSELHQGVVVTLAAVGAAIAFVALIETDFTPTRPSGRRDLLHTVTWVPLVLVFAASIATRAALLVPIELKANWVFRMTERPIDRADRLGAAASAIRRLGVLTPVAIMLPLQWYVMGPGAIAASLAITVFGWLLVEFLLREWRRVPFTCSYILGKAFVPLLIIIGFFSFVIFTTFGSALAMFSARAPLASAPVVGILILAILVMRRNRLKAWRTEAIEFEDTLPNETNALRLSGY